MPEKTKKTKILFVITKSNFGGAQKYVFDLATGIPKTEFEPSVVLGGSGILAGKLRIAGVRVLNLASLERDIDPLKDIASFIELWKMFRSERPDIVHLNSAKASGLGALAGRLALVPHIVFTAHGWAFNEERSFLSRILIKVLSWMTIMLAHKTIAVSESVQRDTEGWPFVQSKIVLIKNGIAEPELMVRPLARTELCARANIPLNPDTFIVGTIAELHNNKGLPYAIEAFSRIIPDHPDLLYVILGDGEEKKNLDTLIKKHGLQKHVFLLGFVDGAARFLKGFDAFLLPSVKEGLPFVILEAGLAGVPVVATTVGGIPEVIIDGTTGILITPRNPQEIADAILRLATFEDVRTALSAALQKKVAQEFSLDTMITKTIDLYTKRPKV